MIPKISTSFAFRHDAKKAVRELLDKEGFLEIDPPYLLRGNTPDPYIDPLIVKRGGGQTLQLHTSPEIWLKKALALGCTNIYHMGRVFRDDPPGQHHSLEFTMLEWYRTGADLSALIEDCQNIFYKVYESAQKAKVARPGLDLSFKVVDLDNLFGEYADIDLAYCLKQMALGDARFLQEALRQKGDRLPLGANFSDAFFHVMLKYIEPNLVNGVPVVIKRWPIQLAALAAANPEDPNYCDRFEIYYGGLEIANAYQECNSPEVLRGRFEKENLDRQHIGKEAIPVDEDFLKSVAQIPVTAGIALGFDRLLLGVGSYNHISQIIFGYQSS